MESFMNNPEFMANAQKMMNNPDFMNQMQEMMKNPMVQQMMSNPEILCNIMNNSGLSNLKNDNDNDNDNAEVEINPSLEARFNKDDIVITSNLSKEEYNSKIANIIMYDSVKDRYIISFDDKKISVKEENIDFYQD